jgi:hypothetical protein
MTRPRPKRPTKRTPPDPDTEMTTAAVAAFLGVKRQNVLAHARRHPGAMRSRLYVPDPPTSGSGRGLRLWRAEDVLRWSFTRGRQHPTKSNGATK